MQYFQQKDRLFPVLRNLDSTRTLALFNVCEHIVPKCLVLSQKRIWFIVKQIIWWKFKQVHDFIYKDWHIRLVVSTCDNNARDMNTLEVINFHYFLKNVVNIVPFETRDPTQPFNYYACDILCDYDAELLELTLWFIRSKRWKCS